MNGKTEMRKASLLFQDWRGKNLSEEFLQCVLEKQFKFFNFLVLSSWIKILNGNISEFWGNSGPCLSH